MVHERVCVHVCRIRSDVDTLSEHMRQLSEMATSKDSAVSSCTCVRSGRVALTSHPCVRGQVARRGERMCACVLTESSAAANAVKRACEHLKHDIAAG